MTRVPDVGNPWLDAGIVPYSTMKYNTDRDYWRQWFPAHFITEAFPGQLPQLVLRHPHHRARCWSSERPMKKVAARPVRHVESDDDKGEEMHKTEGRRHRLRGGGDGERIDGYELKVKGRQGDLLHQAARPVGHAY